MCFYVHNDYQEEKVAEEDIICYKLFSMGVTADGLTTKQSKKMVSFYSFFQAFKYNLNERYDLSRSLKKEIDQAEGFPGNSTGMIIMAGFHSYVNIPAEIHAMRLYGSVFFIECVIPKCAKYYYNSDKGEYVSDQILIGAEIKEFL